MPHFFGGHGLQRSTASKYFYSSRRGRIEDYLRCGEALPRSAAHLLSVRLRCRAWDLGALAHIGRERDDGALPSQAWNIPFGCAPAYITVTPTRVPSVARLKHLLAVSREFIGSFQTKCGREPSAGDIGRAGPAALVGGLRAGGAAFRRGDLRVGRADEACVLPDGWHHLLGNGAGRRIASGSWQHRSRGHAGFVAHPGRRHIRAACDSPAVRDGVAARCRCCFSRHLRKNIDSAPAAELLLCTC